MLRCVVDPVDLFGYQFAAAGALGGGAAPLTFEVESIGPAGDEQLTVADLKALRADVAPPDHVFASLRFVAEAAEEALRGARCRRHALPPSTRAALLPGALAGMALDRLRRVEFNPTKHPQHRVEPGPVDMIRLWFRARAGRY